ncbi:hypothetical protein Pcinc_000602 [Petrolisthes cinctipes]|uniref:Uncharacterized protein n=1 Tax=Petrolisthes cinctipes TaxID=88211 RepID=A0AAE1GMF5_PETCI|nr:hypothetical protein Pcinc_000602 [Petrolisthes cinctipes]
MYSSKKANMRACEYTSCMHVLDSVSREHRNKKFLRTKEGACHLTVQFDVLGAHNHAYPIKKGVFRKTGVRSVRDLRLAKSFDATLPKQSSTGEKYAAYCLYPQQSVTKEVICTHIGDSASTRLEDAVVCGMEEPKDTKKLFETTCQNFTGPNGVIMNSGMKPNELISSLVNALKVGDKSHLTFLALKIYLLKSMKIPVG